MNAKLKNSKRCGTMLQVWQTYIVERMWLGWQGRRHLNLLLTRHTIERCWEKGNAFDFPISDKYIHTYMDKHNTNNVFWNWILELSSKYGGMKERLSKENIPILSLDDSQKHKEKYLSYSNRNLSKLWFCHISVIK